MGTTQLYNSEEFYWGKSKLKNNPKTQLQVKPAESSVETHKPLGHLLPHASGPPYLIEAPFISNLGGKRHFMRRGISSFPMLCYLICHALPGFDVLCFMILPSILASPLFRRRQNILAAKSDNGTKGRPHGYAKPAQILQWQQICSSRHLNENKRHCQAKEES